MSGPPPYSFCEAPPSPSKDIATPHPIFQPTFEHNLNIALSQCDDSEAAKSKTHDLEYPRKDGQRKKITICLIGILITVILTVATAVTVSILASKDTHKAAKLFQPIPADAQPTAPVISTRADSTDGPIIVIKTVTVSAQTQSTSSTLPTKSTVTVTVITSQTPASVSSSTPATANLIPFQPAIAASLNGASTGTSQFSYDPIATATAIENSSSPPRPSINLNGIVVVPLSSTTISGVPTVLPVALESTTSWTATIPSSSTQEAPTKTTDAAPKGTDHIKGGKLGFCGAPGSACMT